MSGLFQKLLGLMISHSMIRASVRSVYACVPAVVDENELWCMLSQDISVHILLR